MVKNRIERRSEALRTLPGSQARITNEQKKSCTDDTVTMRLYTTTEAARTLGLARRTVQRWCAVLGFALTGRDYVLTDQELDQIRKMAQDKPGRPRLT